MSAIDEAIEKREREIIQAYDHIEHYMREPDYEMLFNSWGDFADEDSSQEVKSICEKLSISDGLSFMGFCAGFTEAIKLLREGKWLVSQ